MKWQPIKEADELRGDEVRQVRVLFYMHRSIVQGVITAWPKKGLTFASCDHVNDCCWEIPSRHITHFLVLKEPQECGKDE